MTTGNTNTIKLHRVVQAPPERVYREFLELRPNELIRYNDRFEDPNLPGEIHTTVTLKQVSVGTELNIVQEGVPAVIPAEACYLGWQQSLTLLTQLVEAEIPDEMNL